MTDQHHPIASPQRLADAALAALGGRLDEGDFRAISAIEIDVIHAALERLKLLEPYLD